MGCNNYSQNPSSMNDMHSSAPPKQTPTMDHRTAFNFWETLAAHCWTKTPPVQSVLHGAESWAPHDGGCRFRPPKRRPFSRVPTRDTMPTRSIGTSSPARRCFAQGQPWCVGCKLHGILYANWIPAFGVLPRFTKNTKWRCIKFPLASIFVGFVRFKWSPAE